MGLLDDAIREHLELRRRAGADASEVARLEQDALGPVVRGETARSDSAPTDVDAAQLAIEDAPSADEGPGAAHYADEQGQSGEQEHGDAFQADPTPAFHDHAALFDEAAAIDQHPLSAQPAPDPAAHPEPVSQGQYVPPAAAGQPTEEFDVGAVRAGTPGEPSVADAPPAAPEQTAGQAAEPAPADAEQSGSEQPAHQPVQGEPAPEAGAEGPAGEDVLEQTPEFLQETPEHDRLWFEQAPPKDFDFDR